MVPSDADRARLLHGQIVKAASELYAALDQFCRLKGWQFFGCKSFTEYAAKHLDMTRQSAYQHLAKANALGKIAGALGLPAVELDGHAEVVPWRDASTMANQSSVVFETSAREARADLESVGAEPSTANLAAATATRVRQKAVLNGNPSTRAHTRRPSGGGFGLSSPGQNLRLVEQLYETATRLDPVAGLAPSPTLDAVIDRVQAVIRQLHDLLEATTHQPATPTTNPPV